jgi:3-oxoacyl-[acyl-carrier protein] reductase
MEDGNIRFNFHGQVAIVTGAGQGLGRTVCLEFAAAGARVTAVDVVDENVNYLTGEIEEAGGEALALRVDVSDSRDVRYMVDKTMARWGRIDILVNNAGIAHRGDIFTLTEEGWDELMAINVKGVWMCSREVLRIMQTQGSGRIVNVGSISGWLGGHEVGADYAVSKAGVAVLTKRMANEMADSNITVNSVAPHALETPMTEGHGEEGKRRIMAKIPVKRLGKKEEIAAAIMFLASREAGYITGQTLHANGGTLMVY